MAFDSILIENFKNHVRTELALGDVTICMGPNGCGKSGVLEALFLARRVQEQPLHLLLPEDGMQLRLRSGTASMRLRLEGRSFDQAAQPWFIDLQGAPRGQGFSVSCTWDDQSWQTSLSSPQPRHATPLDRQFATLGSAVALHLDARRIAKPCAISSEAPRIEHDGRNMAAVLADLRLNDEVAFRCIEEELRRVVPCVRGIRFRRVQVQREVEYRERVEGRIERSVVTETDSAHEVLFDMVGAEGVPARVASEGTLVVLALITLLHTPESPRLILLDDLDQGLHPQAQRELMRVLYELAGPSTFQLVATTHSPYLADEVKPADLCVMALDQDGTPMARRLSEHPDAARALEVLTAGEFLSAEGESWVTGLEQQCHG